MLDKRDSCTQSPSESQRYLSWDSVLLSIYLPEADIPTASNLLTMLAIHRCGADSGPRSWRNGEERDKSPGLERARAKLLQSHVYGLPSEPLCVCGAAHAQMTPQTNTHGATPSTTVRWTKKPLLATAVFETVTRKRGYIWA